MSQSNSDDTIFAGALCLPAEERAAYIEQATRGDAALRQRVESLLKGYEDAEFLEQPVPSRIQQTVAISVPLTEKAGDKIGRYKLLQQIGEGGCGVVYMAEQEEPVRRRVALKIIKAGMDTKSVIARFEAERQALALMDHPNIAKVLDAGATEAGRPYFVMELVRGMKLTDYCDEAKLPFRARLDLFMKVCQAIQHAHQKGIIHRDIKPSNVLVTINDGAAVPKVIDFGIAKATGGQLLTDKTVFTAFGQFIGTPAYMSPEQAMLTSLDIDTRSDIYSLGVLLYELLTGKTPFESEELLAIGLDEMRRTIREKEPDRPSTRLSTLPDNELGTTAQSRGLDAPKLISQLRGDLDWIVIKCLEKDRARRYETANGLAADIERHLRNEPVVACPPSNLYRLRKLIRRNKVAFAASALIAAVLLVATVVSVWQAALAKERLDDSEAISKFLTEVFQSPDPARDGRTITVAETLGAAAKRLDSDLASQPVRRAKLQAAIGHTYYTLGLYREAIPLLEEARAYYLVAFGLENTNTLNAMHALAGSYDGMGRYEEALKLQEEVVRFDRKMLGLGHPQTLLELNSLALVYKDVGRLKEAIKLWEQALALDRKVLGLEHPYTLRAMENLSNGYGAAGRFAEALKLREQALALDRKVLGQEHPETLRAMLNLGTSYSQLGRHDDEALKLQEKDLQLYRKVLGSEHPETLMAMNNLACFYDDVGRRDEALKLWEEMVQNSRRALGPEHYLTLGGMTALAESYRSFGHDNEAIALLKEVLGVNPKDSEVFLELATLQTWLGQDADYEATRRRVIQNVEGTEDLVMADRAAKASCLRPSTDAALMAKALALARHAVELGKTNSSLPWRQMCLGLAEYRTGQYDSAEQTLTVAEQMAGDQHNISVSNRRQIQGTARLFRAMSLFRQDKLEEARRLFNEAKAQMAPLPKHENQSMVEGKPASYDDLICWLAYKEAKALIDGTAGANAEAK